MIINSAVISGENMEYVEEAHIVVDDGVISGVFDGFEKGALDMRECVAIPGLINAHVHVGDSFAKEACEGMDASSAVGRRGVKWNLYEKAKESEMISAMRDTLGFMEDTGTTAFVDFREHGIEGVRMLRNAMKCSKMKQVILGRDAPITECDGLGLNVHQLSQIPKERGKKIVAVHAGESKGEIRKALAADPDVIVHFTTGTKAEIMTAKKKDIGIVVCPRANAYLACGFPPVREMIDAGLNVALGTDNVMLSSPDMWREMEYAYKQGRLKGGLEPEEVFKMATVNAARMFGMNSGAIESGRLADVVFIDLKAANLMWSRNVVSALVNRTESRNVKKVLIGGRFVK